MISLEYTQLFILFPYPRRLIVFRKILFFALFLLVGCSTSSKDDAYWCSSCSQQIDGLNCSKEQVWVPRDIVGNAVYAEDTWFWFADLQKCYDFVLDKKNKKLINAKGNMPAQNCGLINKQGRVSGAETFYIYSDGKGDNEHYYLIEDDFKVALPEYKGKASAQPIERYKILLTSESALEIMKKDAAQKGYYPTKVKQITIKRQY